MDKQNQKQTIALTLWFIKMRCFVHPEFHNMANPACGSMRASITTILLNLIFPPENSR
ncbi:hypothetical protein [Xenorhabdus koppenhoeferi]|uniref:hypothetical protein n=1 Tax=Xenorhabdus koppenhoeferi TaxID=351659 RepID=UPI0015A656BD|nr:hypothetical protein [Xenorhabdus koppenhoeferi]